MPEHSYDSEWIDRYLRNELAADQEAEFETALLESAQLQQDLEAAMAIRQALILEDELRDPVSDDARNEIMAGGSRWQSLALAASVILAVFSTTMYWRVSNQAAGLESRIAVLQNPRGTVVTVPVDIMRSSGSRAPDVIVRKPEGAALIVLDIEATQSVLGLDRVQLALRDGEGQRLFSWAASPDASGRIRSALDASSLPAGKLWLEMGREDEVLDRRLLEFR